MQQWLMKHFEMTRASYAKNKMAKQEELSNHQRWYREDPGRALEALSERTLRKTGLPMVTCNGDLEYSFWILKATKTKQKRGK